MAKRYRPVRRDQPFLLPPDMRDWLPPEHPVWLVITVVEEHLDTSVFHAARKTGGAGTAGYDPDMLLAVLVWAYAHQVTSSRRIEQLCLTDVAFKVICGGNTPRHVTISQFRGEFPGLIGEFFGQVLALCARLGMGSLGVVALDGMKIAASASRSANRAERALAKLAAGTVARHGVTDAAEDDLFGPGARGDEVPEDAWRPGRREERIAAALASLRAERAAAEAARAAKEAEYLGAAAAGTPRGGNSPAGVAVRLAAMKVARARTGQAERKAAEKAARRRGPGEPVRNITDPDSRRMPVHGGGFIQGYNTQNVTSADELIIATELTQDTTDVTWFEPMLRQAEDAARHITAHRPPSPAGSRPAAGAALIELFLADAGYLSEHNVTLPGPARLIATGKTRDLECAARDGSEAVTWQNEAIAAMADRLATDDGLAAYRQRGHIAETPHGQIKHNMRFRQLSVRGKPKAAAEWKFTCAVHNLFKAISAGHLTTTALASLASHPPA